jgi:methylenetetrahydrofolate reductase (NADPH)
MNSTHEQSTVLIVTSEHKFLLEFEKLLDSQFRILSAQNENDGFSLARTERPDIIILSYIKPRGTAYTLHQKLRSGWITKNIPILIIDVEIAGQSANILTDDEVKQMEAEKYLCIQVENEGEISRNLAKSDFLKTVNQYIHRQTNLLKAAILDPDIFCVTWEQIPGRGAFETQQEEVLSNVLLAAKSGKIHGISVTDNPGGNPALSSEMLCAQIKKANMEPLLHMACRDKNRNQIESLLYGVAAEGVRNILLLTGDYPSPDAFEGTPKPVFDLDPINAMRLVKIMNAGLEHNVLGKNVTLAKTDFFAGVCVSPYKALESEIMGQYAKLEKKIKSGADFIIPQVGYDVRKLEEILQWLKFREYDIPVVANVYVLPKSVAGYMNRNNVPGCIVTDKLLAETKEEATAEDKGKEARITRAAKQYALAKGLGCKGAHIGGHRVTYTMVEQIIDRGEEMAANWTEYVPEFDYPQDNGFYFFEKKDDSGLNSKVQAPRTSRNKIPGQYRMTRIAHSLLFNEKNVLFKILQPTAARIDANIKRKKRFGWLEHMAKVAMFHCMNCGDCALFDAAYICPMSQCPKQQRNGPCGGSYNGWCEVYPDEKECIWVLAYDRLKRFGEQDDIEKTVVPPCNWTLRETPSWLNFYLGRDHTAKRLGIKPPEKKKKRQKST